MSSSTAVPAAHTPPRGFGRVMTGSMVGAVLEWYDFAVYGILAATVLGPLFFASKDPVVGILAALATQGIGFVARPLGGIVFGHLGDRFGRKPMLVTTFLVLGLSTAAIGLLPTYASVGVWATVGLVTLRLVQGFALGGEFGAAVLLVSEYGDRRRRGFWASWPQAGAPLGTVIATFTVTILTMIFPGSAFAGGGWRWAFLLALPMLAVGFWIRHGVEESPVFREAQRRAEARAGRAEGQPEGPEGGSSIMQALRNPRPLLHGLGVRLGENIAFYVYTIFVVAYATTFHGYARPDVLKVVTVGSVAQFVGMILAGWWSDRVGRRTAMLVPSVLLVLWAPLFFLLIGRNDFVLLGVGVVVGAFLHGMLAGPEAAWITELFPTRYRYAGSSLVFQGSSIIAGAPAPLIAVWLAKEYGVGFVVAYLVITMLVTIVALATCRETAGRDLQDPADDPYPDAPAHA